MSTSDRELPFDKKVKILSRKRQKKKKKWLSCCVLAFHVILIVTYHCSKLALRPQGRSKEEENYENEENLREKLREKEEKLLFLSCPRVKDWLWACSRLQMPRNFESVKNTCIIVMLVVEDIPMAHHIPIHQKFKMMQIRIHPEDALKKNIRYILLEEV